MCAGIRVVFGRPIKAIVRATLIRAQEGWFSYSYRPRTALVYHLCKFIQRCRGVTRNTARSKPELRSRMLKRQVVRWTGNLGQWKSCKANTGAWGQSSKGASRYEYTREPSGIGIKGISVQRKATMQCWQSKVLRSTTEQELGKTIT